MKIAAFKRNQRQMHPITKSPAQTSKNVLVSWGEEVIKLTIWKEIPWWPGLQTYLGENTPADFEMRRLFRFDGETYKAVNCTYLKL